MRECRIGEKERKVGKKKSVRRDKVRRLERGKTGKDAWKVLGTRDEDARERRLEVYKEEKKKVQRCIYHSKKEV